MSSQKTNEFSNQISDFLKFIKETQQNYNGNREEVHRLDKLTQDYLHILELEGLNYKKRAKISTKLSLCRKSRRLSKDYVEIAEPLIMFLDSEKGKGLINMLKDILGKTRRIEDRMETRTYKYKILDHEVDYECKSN